jgi:tetraacyldisaccharide 4'-kinase
VHEALDGPVVAVSAIARPQSFERSLRERGVIIAQAFRFPDHHHYTPADVALVSEAASAAGCRCAITEKDWVKLRDLGCERASFAVARLDVSIDDDVFAGIK